MKTSTTFSSVLRIILLLACLVGVPGNAAPTARAVTSPNDGGAGTLRQLILDSGPDDTIFFDVNINGTITLTSGELMIGRNLTITGPGAAVLTVSGNNASRVFSISSGATVSISGLTIGNGRNVGPNGISGPGSSGQGGGIFNNGALTLSSCVLYDNSASGGSGHDASGAGLGFNGGDGSGGGIYNLSFLTANDCTIRNNFATGGDGSVGNGQDLIGTGGGGWGGGVYNQGSMILTRCTLYLNFTTGGNGGAVFAAFARGGNGGSALGGSVYNQGILALINCTLAANTVTGGAGANENGVATAYGGFGGDGSGAGIWNNQSTFGLAACTISGNYSYGGPGGNSPIGETGSGGSGGSAQAGGVFDSGHGNYINSIIANGAVTGGAAPLHGQSGSGSAFDPDVAGSVSSQGNNFIGKAGDSTGWVVSDLKGTTASPFDPKLGLLQDNGGQTLTMALQSGSAAIDAGNDSVLGPPFNLSTDQRGYPRQRAAHVDIGAFEVYAPQTILVMNNNDSGPGSLRQAIHDAASLGDTITFAGNVAGSISLTSGELLIDKYVDIAGPLAAALTISGSHSSRVFHINVGYYADPIKLSNLTIANGNTNGPGAGLFVETGTALVLNNCTISGNTSGDSGGGIGNNGVITLTNCTVSGNHAVAGGGLYNYCGTLNLWCCTVGSNSAPTGGGFYNYPTVCSDAQISGTLIADNSASSTGPDVLGSFSSAGYNLIGKTNGLTSGLGGVNQLGSIAAPLDPKIGPLQNNGGTTFTHALLAGSPAINSGNSFGLTADQRGNLRPICSAYVAGGDGSDIGAYEYQMSCLTNIIVANTNDGGAGSFRQAITQVEPGGLISFAPSVTGIITLTNGELVIGRSVVIEGPGAPVLTVSGNNLSRVIRIAAANVAISGLGISNGKAPATFNGGGIRVEAPGAALTNLVFANNVAGSSPADGGGLGVMGANSCVVHGSTFVGNQGDNGGAISVSHAAGQLLAVNCTLVNNRASLSTGNGGGLHSWGTATLIASTIVSNSAPGIGGVYRYLGTATLNNCLVAANSGGSTPDINSTVTSGGYNLVGVVPAGFTAQPGDIGGTFASRLNPLVGPLADNGGPTPTMALLVGSPAIDKGKSFGLTTDQRGRLRPHDFTGITNAVGGDGSDIGAFELNLPVLKIAHSTNNVIVSWPASDTGYTLQSKTNLNPSVTWATVSPAPGVSGALYTVTNSAGLGRKFYRLIQ